MKLFTGTRVVLDDGYLGPASIEVDNGRICAISKEYSPGKNARFDEVVDAGNRVLMPGVVDTHVHINEPGRTEWEGFTTATMAAAAGGVTSLVDMPLNSIPPTTTVENLRVKMEAATSQCFVDVGFWGGVIPGNQLDLRPLLKAGVCGFKCFMINSGVDEFPHVCENDIRLALEQLKGTNGMLLFHAEVDCGCCAGSTADPISYQTFLESRPDEMELEAIKTVCRLCLEYNVHCHIVHLSTAKALPIIEETRRKGAPLTIETTHHYLCLDAGSVPDGATEFKCCPPIRSKENQNQLWAALQSGLIDIVISDHSPCTPDLKLLQQGDFLSAWGGVASVQFGLQLFWTNCQAHNMTLHDVCRFLCDRPARIAGLHHKGALRVGMDADIVVWDPAEWVDIRENQIHHKNKITPYKGQRLQGHIYQTFVRGIPIYNNGTFIATPPGTFLLKNHSSTNLPAPIPLASL